VSSPVARRLKGWPGWLVLAVVVVVALAFGAGRVGGPRTNQDRVDAITKRIKCPVCRSESVFESKASASENIRDEVARLVGSGETDDQVLATIDRSFPGQGLLLVPPKTGLASLVWVLPVVALVIGVFGLGLAFWRWRHAGIGPPTDDDRAVVAAALRHDGADFVTDATRQARPADTSGSESPA
jgi:cytochrome c-type biogenesis protein CcmH